MEENKYKALKKQNFIDTLTNETTDALYMYRIQTDARVITGNTTEIKKPRPQAKVFYFEVGFPVITRARFVFYLNG